MTFADVRETFLCLVVLMCHVAAQRGRLPVWRSDDEPSQAHLGAAKDSLSTYQGEIVAALDLLFLGV